MAGATGSSDGLADVLSSRLPCAAAVAGSSASSCPAQPEPTTTVTAAPPSTVPAPTSPKAELIDTYDLAQARRNPGDPNTALAQAPFGGISGLERVNGDVYIGLSDDRAERGPVRVYPLQLPRTDTGGTGNALVAQPFELTDRQGAEYPKGSVDPEAIRLTRERGIVWTSEGDASKGIAPAVILADGHGRAQREMEIPDYHRPSTRPGDAAPMGIENNRAYEGLAVVGGDGGADAERAAVLTEGPLRQDHRNRLTFYDVRTGRPTAEYAYQLDPADEGADARGATELLAVSDSSFLVLERDYVPGKGTRAKLYRISVDGATNVLGTPTLSGTETPVTKETLMDFSPNGENPDNVEGMAWGPTLPDGRRSVLVATDDNFSPSQRTLIHTIALS